MTVKQLIRKLNKLPPDATVTINNDDLYVNGVYVVTGIEYWGEDNTVDIYTDYKKLLRSY